MKKQAKKLTLAKETILGLTEAKSVEGAVVGAPTYNFSQCDTTTNLIRNPSKCDC
jgi:hypothetical protein